MKAYHNTVILKFDDETTGNAGAGLFVTVRLSAGLALADIFDLSDVQILNPITTDTNGNYAFKVADGLYNIITKEGSPDEITLEDVEIVEGTGIDDLSQAYEFPTVAAYKAFNSVFPVGKVVNLLDRGAEFTVIAGTGTANTFDIIASTSVSQSIDLGLTNKAVVDAVQYGAVRGLAQNSTAALLSAYNFSRDNGKELLVSGQFRIDSSLIWNASGGLNAQTTVRFDNARLTKNFNGAGLTCSGGSSMHVHFGDLVIDKMTNLGSGDGTNATAFDDGFVQNSRLERQGSLLIERQGGDGYSCKADTNMNGSKLGSVRIRACAGKGFTGTGTQDDNAIWTGDIWANDCFEGGIDIPDSFNARAWQMTMRGENCAQDGVSDQIYTGGMLGCNITGYAEKNTAGTGVEVHIPAASTNVEFFTWRVDSQTLSSTTSRITQGGTQYVPGTTPIEGIVRADNLTNNVANTVTKQWLGSSSSNLFQQVVRGNGELSLEITGRSTGDTMHMDFLPDSGFTFRVQKNNTDEWKVLDGGVARFLGSLVAGGTSAIDASAIIEARSTTKGLLLPRMNTTQRDAISSPSNGLMIYNTATDKINVRANGAWEVVTSS